MKSFVAATLLVVFTAHQSAHAQSGMSNNVQIDSQSAEAAMVEAWNKAYDGMKRLDDADTSRGGGFGFASAALESQRAWLTFRDSQCVIESGRFIGDPKHPAVQTRCLMRLTRERTQQLRDLQWR